MDALAALGWDADLATAYEAAGRPDLSASRVMAVHRGRVMLRGVAAEDRLAPVAGSLLHRTGLRPVVGDWVLAADEGAVEVVLPRRGVLAREEEVLCANVDLALVATSANQDLNLRRLERFLAMAAGGGVPALVLLTKGDLADDPAADAAAVSDALGCEVLVISTFDGWGVPALRERLTAGRTAALIGSSGVGKSTLVNDLAGAAIQRTLEIREDDARGRHATTHRELFVLPDGGLLLDTPGLRAVSLASGEGLDETFADVDELAAQCRFNDCAHDTEPGCAVRAAIADGSLDESRLLAREKLERETRHLEERDSSEGTATRRARERTSARLYRDVKGRTDR